jgi:hypothetical protein
VKQAFERKIVRVTYSAAMDRVRIVFDDRSIYVVPRRLLQGLENAAADQLRRIEVLDDGPRLFWPLLRVTHTVPRLLAGEYGSKRWMASLKDAHHAPAPREALFVSERRKAEKRIRRFADARRVVTGSLVTGPKSRSEPSRRSQSKSFGVILERGIDTL